MGIIELNGEAIERLPEQDICGTPISGADVHDFKIAASFAKIPQDEWKRLLPDIKGCELVDFGASFYQWGAKGLFGVSLDYTLIDRERGEYGRVIENFARDRSEPADTFFSEMGRKNLLKTEEMFRIEYPFSNKTLASRLAVFKRGFMDAAERSDEMWRGRRERFERIALPCFEGKSAGEVKDIVTESGILSDPSDISWKMWLLDQIISRDDLRSILSEHGRDELDDFEARERASSAMSLG